GCRQRVVRILMEHDAIGVYGQRALGDHDIARELAVLGAEVRAAGISVIEDRLVAVRLFGKRRRDKTCERAKARAGERLVETPSAGSGSDTLRHAISAASTVR